MSGAETQERKRKGFDKLSNRLSSYCSLSDRSFEMNLNFFDIPVEAEWASIKIIERNYRAEVDADIKGFTGGKRSRHRALDRVTTNLGTVNFKDDICGSAGLGNCGFYFDFMLAARQRLLGANSRALDDHHIVLVDQRAIVHVKRHAAACASECIENSGCIFGKLGLDANDVAFATDSGSGKFRQTRGRRIKRPTRRSIP